MNRKLYAVIGDPVAHSLSPVMHNAAFRALGIEAEYVAVHVVRDDLASFCADARKNLAGFNITVPHKNAILPFLDEIDPSARLAGSVNTVTVRDGRLIGCSTDGYGLESALRESFSFSVRGNALLFIGCGGAARAAAFHFAEQGLHQMLILNRTLAIAEGLLAELREHFPAMCSEGAALSDEDRARVFLRSVPVAVQCTSLGLKADDPAPLPPEWLPDSLALFDTIYKPTALLRYAKCHNLPHAAGLGMLLHQGAKSFEIWTGQPAPLDVMRAALPPVPEI